MSETEGAPSVENTSEKVQALLSDSRDKITKLLKSTEPNPSVQSDNQTERAKYENAVGAIRSGYSHDLSVLGTIDTKLENGSRAILEERMSAHEVIRAIDPGNYVEHAIAAISGDDTVWSESYGGGYSGLRVNLRDGVTMRLEFNTSHDRAINRPATLFYGYGVKEIVFEPTAEPDTISTPPQPTS